MGDPRRLRKQYETPAHPWQKETIEADRKLKNEYAFKNKQELWKMNAFLHNFKNQAKKLIAARGTQAERERTQLMQRLQRLGLVEVDAKLDDVLGLTIRDIMERRLQSIVFRKGLARSMKQARQFITHYHVMVGEKKMGAPSYLVPKTEEALITFSQRSTLMNPEHPERVPVERAPKKAPKEQKAETATPETKEEITAVPTEAS